MKSKTNADIVRVKHMLDAINEVALFVRGKSRDSLTADRMLTLALLKELELIGEAAAKVTQSFRELHQAVPWVAIIATRNRLIHGYFDIDLDIVWQTISIDLPKLKKQLEAVLLK